MADFKKMIPFLLHFEAGVPVAKLNLPNAEIFQLAKATGFANHPDDPGGPTMCGVTLKTYTAYRQLQGYQSTSIDDLRNISFRAWSSILKRLFWDTFLADRIRSQMVAVACVDFLWGSGNTAIRTIQRLLGVDPDGRVGPITIIAINSHPDTIQLFNLIQQARHDHHQRIAPPGSPRHKFLRGWTRRVNSITPNGFIYK